MEGEREVRVRKVKFTHSCASGNLLSRSADHEKLLRLSWVGSRVISRKHYLARTLTSQSSKWRRGDARLLPGTRNADAITTSLICCTVFPFASGNRCKKLPQECARSCSIEVPNPELFDLWSWTGSACRHGHPMDIPKYFKSRISNAMQYFFMKNL